MKIWAMNVRTTGRFPGPDGHRSGTLTAQLRRTKARLQAVVHGEECNESAARLCGQSGADYRIEVLSERLGIDCDELRPVAGAADFDVEPLGRG